MEVHGDGETTACMFVKEHTCASWGSLPLYFSWISFTLGCKAWMATVLSTCTQSSLQADQGMGMGN